MRKCDMIFSPHTDIDLQSFYYIYMEAFEGCYFIVASFLTWGDARKFYHELGEGVKEKYFVVFDGDKLDSKDDFFKIDIASPVCS